MRSILPVLLLLPSISLAAPGVVPVQGYLTDAADLPVDGPTLLTMTLYSDDDPATATLLYQDTFSVDIVTGRFEIALGTGANPLDLDVFAEWPDAHLQVTVGTNAPMDPVPLDHVPYAAWAEQANSAVTAESALLADNATTADSATTALSATTADSATTAQTAVEAGHATTADSATNATNATSAVTAQTAVNAQNAASADDADALQGSSLADIESWTLAQCYDDPGEVVSALGGTDLDVESVTIRGTTDVNTNGGGSLVIGNQSDEHVRIDGNELYAYDDGVPEIFGLNPEGDVLLGRSRVLPTTDVSLTNQGPFMIGSTGGANLAMDGNEIMARTNGSASTLYLQNDGGVVSLGDNSGLTYLELDIDSQLQGLQLPTDMNRYEIAQSCTVGRMYVATTVFGQMLCVCLNNEYMCIR